MVPGGVVVLVLGVVSLSLRGDNHRTGLAFAINLHRVQFEISFDIFLSLSFVGVPWPLCVCVCVSSMTFVHSVCVSMSMSISCAGLH